jgi:hypothetical protein
MKKKLSKLLSKNFKNNILSGEGGIRSLIMLGDGDRDDLVIPIVCHHLNGEKTVGITKPVNPRIGAISELPVILPLLNVNKIALVMDQEGDELKQLYKQIEKKLRKMNIKFKKEVVNRRLMCYFCKLGPRKFELILIISGIDEMPLKTHKIEDHLLKTLSTLSKAEYEGEDSKEAWESLGKSAQREVLLKLKDTRKLCLDIFPQHFLGLRLLE